MASLRAECLLLLVWKIFENYRERQPTPSTQPCPHTCSSTRRQNTNQTEAVSPHLFLSHICCLVEIEKKLSLSLSTTTKRRESPCFPTANNEQTAVQKRSGTNQILDNQAEQSGSTLCPCMVTGIRYGEVLWCRPPSVADGREREGKRGEGISLAIGPPAPFLLILCMFSHK